MRFTRLLIAAGCVLACGLHAAERGGQSPIPLLIERLSDDDFKTREQASRQVWELGDPALPALREAVKSGDPELAYRARDLLRKIELHITPSTDPGIIEMVERYVKASSNEKIQLMAQMRAHRAWRQMLKLFAAEKNQDLRAQFQSDMEDVARVAARERLLEGDAKGAREFLEMAPVTPDSLVALAAFHRSQGTLEAELQRASTLQGINSDAWKLALHRAAGNSTAAMESAMAAGNERMAAAMAVLAGDPVPWLRQNSIGDGLGGAHERYPALAIRRWEGGKPAPADLEMFRRMLESHENSERRAAMSTLILLGKPADAEARFARDSPLAGFSHFESMERIPEALEALGLDPEAPGYAAWVAARMERILEAADDEGDHSQGIQEMVRLARYLEHRGLHDEAYAAFVPHMKLLAEENPHAFSGLLGTLFSRTIGPFVLSGRNAPTLALRIGSEWAGEDEERWETVLGEAFGATDTIEEWWAWLEEQEPGLAPEKRFRILFALHSQGIDPENLHQQWMDRIWEVVEALPDEERAPHLVRITSLSGGDQDVANTLRAFDHTGRKVADLAARTSPHSINGTALLFTAGGRWEDAAELYLAYISRTGNRRTAHPELHAYAAACLRRAGKIREAEKHDDWAEQLALGDRAANRNIAMAYAFGCDFERAAIWHARAAHECDPDSLSFADALDGYAEVLLEKRNWRIAASTSEALALIKGSLDSGNFSPSYLMHARLQADFTRAMSILDTRRDEAIALLADCHRIFASHGVLADHFFPALREAGLRREHDEWFGISWGLIHETISRFPACDNILNTAGWFASRCMLRLDEAEKLQRQALGFKPNQPAYLDTMAEIEFARGNRDEAVRWGKLAVNFEPRDLMIRQQYHRFLHGPFPQ